MTLTLRKVLVSYAVGWLAVVGLLAVLLNHPAAEVLYTPRVRLTPQTLEQVELDQTSKAMHSLVTEVTP